MKHGAQDHKLTAVLSLAAFKDGRLSAVSGRMGTVPVRQNGVSITSVRSWLAFSELLTSININPQPFLARQC